MQTAVNYSISNQKFGGNCKSSAACMVNEAIDSVMDGFKVSFSMVVFALVWVTQEMYW